MDVRSWSNFEHAQKKREKDGVELERGQDVVKTEYGRSRNL